MAKLTIIGIGYKPLDERSKKALSDSRFILGSRRLIEVFEGYPEHETSREKVKKLDSVTETMEFIHESFRRGEGEIVLLGSGDPLFFGIGARAVGEFGPDAVEIIPDLTSLQTAFSLIKEPWDDALFLSLHGGPDPAKRRRLKYRLQDLRGLLDDYDTIGILTDKENDPPAIARFLLSSVTYHRSLMLFIGERMGYGDGRITKGHPEEIATMSFVHPNVVIIKRISDQSHGAQTRTLPSSLPRFGLREDEINHSQGLITKDEVRAVSIHALRLPDTGVLWDIGAGSGAIAIEAARLCPRMDVFAVEKNEDRLREIEQNKTTFTAANLTVVRGEAPSALSALPAPDRVFIGGSSGRLRQLIDLVAYRMTTPGGIVVVNAATLETLNEAVSELERSGFSLRVSELSVARSKPIGDKRYLAALNPVFVIVGTRSEHGVNRI